jgi:hypothetical protein
MTITPAALRMIFAFLAESSMLNAPQSQPTLSILSGSSGKGLVWQTCRQLNARACAADASFHPQNDFCGNLRFLRK